MVKMRHTAALTAMVATLGSATMMAQLTGVSHPEQVPVTTSAEGIAQPVVFEPQAESQADVTANPAPGLRQRPVQGTPGAVITAGSSAYVPYAPAAANAPRADEVAAARLEDRSVSTPDPDGMVVVRVAGPSDQLPTGTRLMVQVNEALSTRTTRDGQEFHARLTVPVERDGRVLLPVGSEVVGKVTDVHGGRRVTGTASIRLEPHAVILPDGTRYELKAQVIDTGLVHATRVDEEGTILRRDHARETAAVFALAAGSGAAAGAVLGGVPGALIGASLAAGITTVHWLKTDRQAELPAGTRIVFALERPITFSAE